MEAEAVTAVGEGGGEKSEEEKEGWLREGEEEEEEDSEMDSPDDMVGCTVGGVRTIKGVAVG